MGTEEIKRNLELFRQAMFERRVAYARKELSQIEVIKQYQPRTHYTYKRA